MRIDQNKHFTINDAQQWERVKKNNSLLIPEEMTLKVNQQKER